MIRLEDWFNGNKYAFKTIKECIEFLLKNQEIFIYDVLNNKIDITKQIERRFYKEFKFLYPNTVKRKRRERKKHIGV